MMLRHSSTNVATLDFWPFFASFLDVFFVFHDILAKTLNLVKYPLFAFKMRIQHKKIMQKWIKNNHKIHAYQRVLLPSNIFVF